jgi:plastocyanin
MYRLLVGASLAALLALPATVFAATKPVPVTLSGTFFNNKPNAKLTVKLGTPLRFVWKDGFHNVLTQKAPAGAKKVNSGALAADHKPILFTPGKKGKYLFYCAPHKALGMVLTVTVK